MRYLGIDLETFSSVDLSKCGVYKYAESPDFEILLLGYAWDGEAPVVVDLAMGERIPPEVEAALLDQTVVKSAWNAAFERTCLARYFGRPMPPEQWEDTMITASVCGLPLSLGGAGAALGMQADQAKDKEGKALIRWFCQPCKPTKREPDRVRHFPQDEPEKWEAFKRYNAQDVVAERAIREKLKPWTPTGVEREIWRVDQDINDRGVRIDMTLARAAVEMDEAHKAELTARAVALTGMENPNSVAQIKQWLYDQEGVEVPSLNKKEVADVVAGLNTQAAKDFMALRAELSKSSTKKYDAMLRAACRDDHVRGCFMFCGAGRTGRWCLTGDHEVLTPSGWVRIDQWEGGPICVWSKSTEALSFQKAGRVSFDYEGPMVVIDQQRCAQISTPDHKMPVLKNGRWDDRTMGELVGHSFQIPFTGQRGASTTINTKQTSTFAFKGPVYCATTTTGYFLVRRLGRVWITGNSGRLVQLQNLSKNKMEDLSACRALVRAGDLDGLKLLYGNVSGCLSELVRTALIPEQGHRFIVCDYSAIESRVLNWIAGEEWVLEEFHGDGLIYEATGSRMFGVPKRSIAKGGENHHLRASAKVAELACGYGGGIGAMKAFGADKMGMSDEDIMRAVDLWRSAHPNVCRLWKAVERAAVRCVVYGAPQTSTLGGIRFDFEKGILWMTLPSGRRIAYFGARYSEGSTRRTLGRKVLSYMGLDQKTHKWVRLETYGPKMVENLVQATARDCLRDAMLALDREGYSIRAHIHDEVILSEPVGGRSVEDVAEVMGRPLPWAPGLPLRGDGYQCSFYMKD